MTINKNREKNIKAIKIKTGNANDITYKNYPVDKKIITFIYSNSVSSQKDIISSQGFSTTLELIKIAQDTGT